LDADVGIYQAFLFAEEGTDFADKFAPSGNRKADGFDVFDSSTDFFPAETCEALIEVLLDQNFLFFVVILEGFLVFELGEAPKGVTKSSRFKVLGGLDPTITIPFAEVLVEASVKSLVEAVASHSALDIEVVFNPRVLAENGSIATPEVKPLLGLEKVGEEVGAAVAFEFEALRGTSKLAFHRLEEAEALFFIECHRVLPMGWGT
jgi:hypothetical protein